MLFMKKCRSDASDFQGRSEKQCGFCPALSHITHSGASQWPRHKDTRAAPGRGSCWKDLNSPANDCCVCLGRPQFLYWKPTFQETSQSWPNGDTWPPSQAYQLSSHINEPLASQSPAPDKLADDRSPAQYFTAST